MKFSWLVAFSVILIAFGVSSTAARADITSNLAVYYKFDGTSGTSATDSSGNSNTGTMSNSTFTQAGKYSWGYSSTNSTSSVTVASNASLVMSSFTIATWAYFKTTASTQYFAERGVTPATNNYYFYWLSGTGYICGFYDGSGYRELAVAGTPTTYTWAHFACTFNNTTKVITIYKNGVSIGTSTQNYTPVTAASLMMVGRSGDNSQASFTGLLDEFRLYSRALSADDIAELYRTPIWATSCSSPAGNAGDIIYDTTTRKMAYCNATTWVQMGPGPRGGGGCTSPASTAGTIMFDSTNRVMKHCNGQEWAPWGVVGGISSGSGCTSPTGIGGSTIFNADFRVLQYCDGKTWENVGGYQPTMVMDFAGGKYSINGTSYASYAAFKTAIGLTFSRTGTAMYFNSAGTLSTAATNTERFDYDPVTLKPRGLMLEESRINYFLQSNTFSNASWTKSAVTATSAATTAPDGTLTGWSINPTGGGNSYFTQAVTFSAGQKVTASFYAKAGGGHLIWLDSFINSAEWGTQFDLSTGVVSNIAPGLTAEMQPVGNGWYRIRASATMTKSSAAGDSLSIFYVDDYGVGVAGHNVYIWGAQFEFGPDASSYIPTTTATVTRNADLAYFTATGSWYDSTKGTFLGEAYFGMQSSDPTNTLYYNNVLLGAYSTPTGDKTWLQVNNSATSAGAWAGTNSTGMSVASGFSPSTSRLTTTKMGMAWSDSSAAFKIAANGTLGTAGGYTPYSASVSNYTANQICLGCGNGGANYLVDGSVKSIVYFPFKLTDTQLTAWSQRSQ